MLGGDDERRRIKRKCVQGLAYNIGNNLWIRAQRALLIVIWNCYNDGELFLKRILIIYERVS